jgi:torulene dioxygenase
MALNGPGVHHRTREHEVEDASNITKNFLAESWRSWPNEAAVSHLYLIYQIKN